MVLLVCLLPTGSDVFHAQLIRPILVILKRLNPQAEISSLKNRQASEQVWSSAWLYLGDWWGWLIGSSCTAAGCLSWEVWWLMTRSMGFAILLSTNSYCRLSWERWLHPLHLLGPVLLGCCLLQLNLLSSMIVLQPPHLCEGWGGHPLCLSDDSSVLMDLRWSCSCTAQSSILSIGSVSVALLWGIFLNDLGQ